MRQPLPRRTLQRSLDGAVQIFNRNPWTSRELHLAGRSAAPVYDEDGLRTDHAHRFTESVLYRRAYARAVLAGGFDYRIRWRVHTMLWAAKTAARLDGAFVECGTGKGFMATAICEYMGWTDRPFFLFDTFRPSDSLETAPYYAATPELVAENFHEWPGVRLVMGMIPESFSEVTIDRVAFLHVDMNEAAPEADAVRHFWPLLSPGGILIFDDYGGSELYESSRNSADRLSAELGFTVLASPTGQGIAIKT